MHFSLAVTMRQAGGAGPVRYIRNRNTLAQHRGRESMPQGMRREPRRDPCLLRRVHELFVNGAVLLVPPVTVAWGERAVPKILDHVPQVPQPGGHRDVTVPDRPAGQLPVSERLAASRQPPRCPHAGRTVGAL
jgi:hypothetical protein